MTIQEVTEKIREQAGRIDPFGARLKFDFGEDIVYLDGTGNENIVSNEDNEADCVITTTLDTFDKISSGKLNPMMAMMTKKIRIKGDMGVAMRLQSLIKG